MWGFDQTGTHLTSTSWAVPICEDALVRRERVISMLSSGEMDAAEAGDLTYPLAVLFCPMVVSIRNVLGPEAALHESEVDGLERCS